MCRSKAVSPKANHISELLRGLVPDVTPFLPRVEDLIWQQCSVIVTPLTGIIPRKNGALIVWAIEVFGSSRSWGRQPGYNHDLDSLGSFLQYSSRFGHGNAEVLMKYGHDWLLVRMKVEWRWCSSYLVSRSRLSRLISFWVRTFKFSNSEMRPRQSRGSLRYSMMWYDVILINALWMEFLILLKFTKCNLVSSFAICRPALYFFNVESVNWRSLKQKNGILTKSCWSLSSSRI